MDLARAGQMARFDHERLDVYQVSVRTVALVYAGLDRTPRGFADLAAQTKRAAFSVPLNIAEAAGEFSKPEKRRIFRIARRSATECAAALDLLQAVGAIQEKELESIRVALDRVVAMLTALTRPRPTPHAQTSPDPPPNEEAQR